MTNRNDTIAAWQEHLTAKKNYNDALAAIELPESKKILKRRSRVDATANTASFASMIGALPIAAVTESMTLSFASVGISAVIMFGSLPLKNRSKATKQENEVRRLSDGLGASHVKFWRVLADEMRSLGMRIMEVNREREYIVTDRGNVTVVFRDGSDVPVPLLNGSAIQSSYLSDTYQARDSKGNLVHVPNSLVVV